MANTIATLFIDSLARAGVTRVWGVPGDSLNAFTDALYSDGRLTWMHVRHEEGAAFSAGADAAITGELAVIAGSTGPGNLHFINGLYEAQRSRVPLLAIASHIPREQIGSSYFQETRPHEVFRECSVYSELVSDASQLPWVLEAAMRAAVEKRGVAVVVVPSDVFFERAPERRLSAPIRATHTATQPAADELLAAASILNSAQRVTILAGAGVAGARDEVLALAERLQSPIVHALRGKEYLEYDNPFDVGMTGLLGFTSGYRAMERADALLILGSGFPYRQFYPRNARIVQVDIRGEELGKHTPIDLGLVGDTKSTAAALLPLLTDNRDQKYLADAVKHYAAARKRLDSLAVNDGHTPLHPQYVMRTLSRLAAADAIFTADVGTPTVWAARYLEMTEQRRLLGSFTHGSMANALPQALGAQASNKERQVISLSGDGGVTMLLGELLTATQNDLPIKVVVFNNSSLNFVELEMKAAGILANATDLKNPNFAEVATALGYTGIRVEDGAELETAVQRMLDTPGPVLLDVVVARDELSMPPKIEAAQAKGFALWAMRAVLSGRGTELIDLADTNVWRRIVDHGEQR